MEKQGQRQKPGVTEGSSEKERWTEYQVHGGTERKSEIGRRGKGRTEKEGGERKWGEGLVNRVREKG